MGDFSRLVYVFLEGALQCLGLSPGTVLRDHSWYSFRITCGAEGGTKVSPAT